MRKLFLCSTGLSLFRNLCYIACAMSTLTEIEAALPKLTREALMRLEAALHKLQRERKEGIIFDDAYGVWSEDDQASLAAEAWQIIDGKPGPE